MKYYKDKTTGKFISKKAYIEQNYNNLASMYIPSKEEIKLMEKKNDITFDVVEGILLILTFLVIFSLATIITSYLFL